MITGQSKIAENALGLELQATPLGDPWNGHEIHRHS
jgi:hypothetical protein